MRFFFFGTLMDEEVLALVVSYLPPPHDRRPAILSGYRRVKARGVSYPVIVEAERSSVEGLLVSGLDRAAAERLAAYEGAAYEAAEVTVSVAGRPHRALVFVPRPGGGLVPLDEDWHYEEWRRRHGATFVARLRRWKTAERASD